MTVLILAMMIMLACSTITAREEYMTVGSKGIPLNTARAERAVFG